MAKKNNKRSVKKGGCGCSFLKGGSNIDLAINKNSSVIPYNQSSGTINDPLDPKSIIDTRMQPNIISGGSKSRRNKKRKSAKKTKRTRKLLKGGIVDPTTANAISGFGSTSGLTSAFNILSGTRTVDPSPLVQPTGTSPFGPNNPALV